MLIETYDTNPHGRDFAVGDIHGHFTELLQALRRVRFDTAKDRLFSVGDLVDRGPECDAVLSWLDAPWFHAVRGNHEDYVCRYMTVDRDNWICNGGSWFLSLPSLEQRMIAARLKELPFAIEVQTPAGTVGIVHADIPFPSWHILTETIHRKSVQSYCMWSRHRIKAEDETGVAGVRAVVVGHEPLRRAALLGNVYHIDTMGWCPNEGGYFTLLNLQTLEAIPPLPGKLEF